MAFTFLLVSLLAISSVRSHSLSSIDFERNLYLDVDREFQMLWNYNETHILIQVKTRQLFVLLLPR